MPYRSRSRWRGLREQFGLPSDAVDGAVEEQLNVKVHKGGMVEQRILGERRVVWPFGEHEDGHPVAHGHHEQRA